MYTGSSCIMVVGVRATSRACSTLSHEAVIARTTYINGKARLLPGGASRVLKCCGLYPTATTTQARCTTTPTTTTASPMTRTATTPSNMPPQLPLPNGDHDGPSPSVATTTTYPSPVLPNVPSRISPNADDLGPPPCQHALLLL